MDRFDVAPGVSTRQLFAPMAETIHRFHSSRLGNERTVWIREPGPDAGARDLVIFLDAELYRDRVGAVSIVENLVAEKVISDAFYVFVSHHSMDARWRECPCFPTFVPFVVDELIPWLEALHPSMRGRRERVLVGLSYTGLAAAWVAIESPGTLTKVIAQSGSFWWNDCWLTRRIRERGARPDAAFHLDVGVLETAENVQHKEDVLQRMSQVDAVRGFRDTLRESGACVPYHEFDGGHDYAWWAQTLPAALRWAVPVPTSESRFDRTAGDRP